MNPHPPSPTQNGWAPDPPLPHAGDPPLQKAHTHVHPDVPIGTLTWARRHTHTPGVATLCPALCARGCALPPLPRRSRPSEAGLPECRERDEGPGGLVQDVAERFGEVVREYHYSTFMDGDESASDEEEDDSEGGSDPDEEPGELYVFRRSEILRGFCSDLELQRVCGPPSPAGVAAGGGRRACGARGRVLRATAGGAWWGLVSMFWHEG